MSFSRLGRNTSSDPAEKSSDFVLCSPILFLPSRKKLKSCSDPAEKNPHILFQLGPEKHKFLPTKGHFLPMEGVLGWKKMINHLIMTQSNPPYRFLRSLECPFKVRNLFILSTHLSQLTSHSKFGHFFPLMLCELFVRLGKLDLKNILNTPRSNKCRCGHISKLTFAFLDSP